MERKRAAEAAEREAEFQQLYSEVLGGLQHGHEGVLTDVQEVLEYAETTQHTRKAALCQQWHSQVFEPIQERLQQAMAKRSIAGLESTLQAASNAYVQASNTKRLFLDVVMGDYNALELGSSSIQVHTADLNDPLLHDLAKAHAEKTLLSSAAGGGCSSSSTGCGASSGQAGRVGSSRVRTHQPGQLTAAAAAAAATAWPRLQRGPCWRRSAGQQGRSMPLPYGHCIDDKTAEYIVRPAAPQSLAQKASNVFFDDFTPT